MVGWPGNDPWGNRTYPPPHYHTSPEPTAGLC